MPRHKAVFFLSFLPFLLLVSCALEPTGSSPKEFAPHELAYGGDTEESLSYERFSAMAEENYQKSAKYKNAIGTLTSEAPLYDESDRFDYFKDFNELRFVMIPWDENRDFKSRGIPFFMPTFLLPINFDANMITIEYRSSTRVGHLVSFLDLISNFFENWVKDCCSFYQYRIKGEIGESFELFFSKDYYPVRVTWTYESAKYEMGFKYYNLDDLPNITGEVDRETFLIHAYARANQSLTTNFLSMGVELKDWIISQTMVVDEELGVCSMKYITGSGTMSYALELSSSEMDKTALPLISDINKTITLKDFSSTFGEQEDSFLSNRYYEPVRRYLFNGYSAIYDFAFFSGTSDVERKFFVSPLRAERKEYSVNKKTGDRSLAMASTAKFSSNGLLNSYSKNYNDGSLPDEITYSFVYSSI